MKNELYTKKKHIQNDDKLSPQYAANLCTMILGYVHKYKTTTYLPQGQSSVDYSVTYLTLPCSKCHISELPLRKGFTVI